MLAFLIATSFLAQSADELAIVRYDLLKPQKKAGVFVSSLFGEKPTVFASDPSFTAIDGERRASHLFGIDLDGDRVDEFAVIRERMTGKGRYTMAIHAVPAKLVDDVSAPVEKLKANALGSRAEFGEIVDADGIDLDGDFQDELMLMRRVESGLQRLEIFETPKAGADLGPPLASYLDLGAAPLETVLHVVAIDIDGDAREEIALVKSDTLGTITVEVIPAPHQVGTTFPGVISSGILASPGFGLDAPALAAHELITDVDASDFDDNGVDELLVLRQFLGFMPAALGFADRIDVLALPIGGTLPLISQILHDPIGSIQNPVSHVVVLRGQGAKPNLETTKVPLKELLDGVEFTLTISAVTNTGGYAGGSGIIVGPIEDVRGEFAETPGSYRLESPTIGDFEGTFAESTGTVTIPATTIEVENPAVPGDMLVLELTNLQFHQAGQTVTVFGQLSGEIETSFGTVPLLAASIFGISKN